jgi:hypothetical protein
LQRTALRAAAEPPGRWADEQHRCALTTSVFREPARMRPDRLTRMLKLVSIWIVGAVGAVLFIAWITAVLGLAFVRVRTEIEIVASKEIVWATLSDFASYPAWNPNTIEIRGTLESGERVDFRARIGESVRELNAQIDQVREFEEISWTGPVSGVMRTFFWGEHRFAIEEISPRRVRFTNSERFGGLFALPMWTYLTRDVAAAYDAANLALKRWSEQRMSGQ